jgi:hypothetical protein
VSETYTQALSTVAPRKATANFHRLYINFAKFYEDGGTTGQAQADLDSARKIFEKATKVNFKTVEDVAEIWCEWAEMELRQECVQPVSFSLAFLIYLQQLRRGNPGHATCCRYSTKYEDQLSRSCKISCVAACALTNVGFRHYLCKRGCSNH